MYFDTAPKTDRKDFFNYEEEFEGVVKAIRRERLIVIKGLRRVGKSSLMGVVANSLNRPYEWIDCRAVHSKEGMAALLNKTMKRLAFKLSLFSRIEIKEINLPHIALSLKEEEDSEEVIRKSRIKALLFIDEAQLLLSYGFDRWLAYIYDRLPSLTTIIAGSQIGLLERLIGKNNGSKALKGRSYYEITLHPLSRAKALTFLMRGFEEVGKSVPMEELNEAVNRLGGFMGWLTLYGHKRVEKSHGEALEEVEKLAQSIVADELFEFLERQRNKKAYMEILKGMATYSLSTWEQINSYLISKKLTHSRGFLSKALKKLKEHSFIIEKDGKYIIADPLVRTTLKNL